MYVYNIRNLAATAIIAIATVSWSRGGGTGLAAAGPKLNRNPQFKFFTVVKYTNSFN